MSVLKYNSSLTIEMSASLKPAIQDMCMPNTPGKCHELRNEINCSISSLQISETGTSDSVGGWGGGGCRLNVRQTLGRACATLTHPQHCES